MNYLFAIIFSLFPQKIRVATSVDWLCYDASTIAMVKVDNYKEENFKINEYSSTGTITATITKLLKGSKPLLNQITIYTQSKFVGWDSWPMLKGKEVLVFLKLEGCEEECVYSLLKQDNALVDLSNPRDKMITGLFKVLKQKADMETYVSACTNQLKGKTAEPFYLEVPYETEAYDSLYSGSSCYLIVPDVLYPLSKKTF